MSASRHVTIELVSEALSGYTIGHPATRDDAVPATELREKILDTLAKHGLRRACSYQQQKGILQKMGAVYVECRRAPHGRARCVQFVRLKAAAVPAALPALAHGEPAPCDGSGPEDAAAAGLAPAPPLTVDMPRPPVVEAVAHPAGAFGVTPAADGASPVPRISATTATAGTKRYRGPASPAGTPDTPTRRRLTWSSNDDDTAGDDAEPVDDRASTPAAMSPSHYLAGAGSPPRDDHEHEAATLTQLMEAEQDPPLANSFEKPAAVPAPGGPGLPSLCSDLRPFTPSPSFDDV